MDYQVKLEMFEGPLDLLLHLIHKNEVDIFDIPIATIADQYLEYLDLMKALEMGIAGDFLVMASTLLHIKSKMLLPGPFEGEEEEDPRLEITRPLLEYIQIKELADDLSQRHVLGRDVFTRSEPESFPENADAALAGLEVSVFQLMDAFREIMARRKPDKKLQVQLEQWSVKEKTEYLVRILRKKNELFFEEIFAKGQLLSEMVVTFLALLELVHMGLAKVFQPSVHSKIRVAACFSREDFNGAAK